VFNATDGAIEFSPTLWADLIIATTKQTVSQAH
jgi:hypothetical protein